MAEKKNTAAMVYDLAKPIADELGLYLWDVRFEKEGSSWFLRVIIDSEEGITFTECENMSRPLSDLLDEKDFIEQSYYLEVSSPGLMRELRREDHFLACMGEEVLVKLIRPFEGQREFVGILTGFDHGTFTIEVEEGEYTFTLQECSFVKLNDDVDF